MTKSSGALKVNLDKAREIIDSLHEGEEIEVHIADHSKNYNVKKITNVVVACHKRVAGRFLGIYWEKAYGSEYLAMTSWDYTQKEDVIWMLLVAGIVHVQLIANKPKKVTSNVGHVYLGGGQLKTIEREGGIGELVEI